jgi:NAD-dependent SIR2 family protein deacetylase
MSDKVYCVKCGKKTDSTNCVIKMSKNHRKRMACKCADCGTKKSMFVSSGSRSMSKKSKSRSRSRSKSPKRKSRKSRSRK